jgi:DNA-binding response OmpR family regulator
MARVLVVDDDPDILRIVEKVLRMNNHDVYTAYDAMKAMDLLNASIYDLVITDANMPRFSGFELVRTVRNNKRFQRTAVCMLTGLREKKDIEKAIRAGVDDYIVKPIDPMVLLQKIEGLFIKKPPMERAEYTLPEGASFAQAQLSIPARITKVSELGLTLRCSVEVYDSLAIEIVSSLFKKMDIKTPPAMKVISVQKVFEFDYEIKIAFTSVSDSFHQKVRAWIHSQIPSKKGAA